MKANDAFREVLERSGMSHAQVAEVLGIAKANIGKAAIGRRIGADALAQYCQACGFTLALVPDAAARFLPSSAIYVDGE